MPIVVLTLAQAARRTALMRGLAVAALVGVAANGAVLLHRQSYPQSVFDLHDKGQFIAAEQLAKTGIHIVSDQPQSPFNPDLTLADVASLRARGKSFDYPINDHDRAAAQLALRVGSTEAAVLDRPVGGVVAPVVRDFRIQPRPNGCVRLRPNGAGIELHLDGRRAFTITSSEAAMVELYLQFPSGFAGPRYVGIKPGVRTTVVSDVTGVIVMQRLPTVSEICGVTWQ